ncbi:MAG: 7-carboxy-7-deazaguanine synthase QueE [Saprospiraceae bacterium]
MKKPILKLALLDGQPEIFYSIQGEGRSMGIPSVFIRTSNCNLQCIWCDTDYTWNWTGTEFKHIKDTDPGYQKFEKQNWQISCEVIKAVELIKKFNCKNVILTGGEPMLQQPMLIDLMSALRLSSPDYHFEVETNGTILPDPGFQESIDQYNVSPKLENSGNPRKLREKSKALSYFSGSPKANFKFVIMNKHDLNEVLGLIQKYDISPEKVWLMPEGTSSETLSERRMWLVEICKEYGFRYSDRLHVHIWGAKKGV